MICSLAESYVNGAAREAGAAAEVAASRKEEKYADLDIRYLFEPIAVETLGVLNCSGNSLLKEIDKISLNTGESREAFPIPAHFGASAALQCHSVARFFAYHRLRGLNMRI